ncbi:MAG: endolytic transglycosylase MltG [Ruminococcaceae bacterium]|nr:endolytic transglycosylase MltG [Oscillospiraceae bacterium]
MDNNQDKQPYKDELSAILDRNRDKYERNARPNVPKEDRNTRSEAFKENRSEKSEEPKENRSSKFDALKGNLNKKLEAMKESRNAKAETPKEDRNTKPQAVKDDVKTYTPENQTAPGTGELNRAELVEDNSAALSEEQDLRDVEFAETDIEDRPRRTKKSKRAIEAEKKLKRQRQAWFTAVRIVLGIAVSGFVLFFGVKLGSGIYSAVTDYAGISSNEFEVQIELPNNPSLDQVAEILSENGIISTPDFFKWYVEKKKEDKDIVTDFVGGQFTLSSSMNYGTIVSTLLASKTQTITVEVTIVEGMTAYDIGQLLEENFVCKASDFQKFYRDKMDVYDFEKRLLVNTHKFNQMEGYLFPDKYEFYVCNELKDDPKTDKDTSKEAEVAAKKIYSNFNSKISKSMYKKMNELGLTLDEFVTLSSMVQAEVSNTEDMKLVASVFLNRLNSNGEIPKLQSDVTVFYVQDYIEPYYKDYGLTTSLAVISNSYDTYECDGVPAGAICNPGLDAMSAVLDAAETDYYYFCANMETGETYFARTIEEHEANLVLAGLA